MAEQAAGWSALLRRPYASRALVVAGGMAMHAINVFIVITILPTVVRDIGGLEFFAWNTTLYVVASVLAGGLCARIVPHIGARYHYRAALGLFALGSTICALAPSMPVLLAGRLVQGLGAGSVSALSYTMVRTLFPERMWPTAISVISASWGIATCGGPALGGLFAAAGAWRGAFWAVAAVAPCLWLLVEAALPRDLPRPKRPAARLAIGNLALLCGSVLAVSMGSAEPGGWRPLLGLVVALAGLALFVHQENNVLPRLMPRGACRLSGGLGATYAAMLCVVVGINTEIFVPYFLQTLHGFRPIEAGYLSALMSAGWTTGSVGVSGARAGAVPRWMMAGPLVLAAALLTMAVMMPRGGLLPEQDWLLAFSLFAQGCGIGMCWPHLAAGVFRFAAPAEQDLAASSMTLVIMVSNALGSALAGLVANLAGLAGGGAAGAGAAAAWLFGLYALAPLGAFVSVRRILVLRRGG